MPFVAGYCYGLGLIVAIGAQNAFVLRQGLRRRYIGWVCGLCIGSDALLIAAGVFGVGRALAASRSLHTAIAGLGVVFLWGYALLAGRRALRAGGTLKPGEDAPASRRRVIVTTLALTWLNPHVYIDTLLLLGGLADGYGQQRYAFALGAMAASATFFVALGYGARLLAPWLDRRGAWRLIDACIVVVMAYAGWRLFMTLPID